MPFFIIMPSKNFKDLISLILITIRLFLFRSNINGFVSLRPKLDLCR